MHCLVIGYGNPSRRDDGVALAVLNVLRGRWGRPPLAWPAADEEDLDGTRDSLFVPQLVPELAPTLAAYDLVVLVDAALPAAPELVRVEPVAPAYRLGVVSHHLEPSALLALTAQLFGHTPRGYIVSIRGEDFSFGDRLSCAAARAAGEAADRIEGLIGAGCGAER